MVRELLVLPPLAGLRDGIDAALPDEIYHPNEAPVLENLRVRQGKIETRPGMAASYPLPSTGQVRLYGSYYPVGGADAGARFRVLVQGSTFYYLKEGTHVSYQAASGGTGLGTTYPYYSFLQENDRLYFVDGVGALRQFQSTPTSGNQVRSVAQPVAPAVAPRFVVRAYRAFAIWSASEVAAWNAPSANFTITHTSSSDPSPGPFGGSATFTNVNTSAKGNRITRYASGALFESLQVAFYLKSAVTKTLMSFDLGQVTPGDYSTPLTPTLVDSWQPTFIDTSQVPAPNYVSVKSIHSGVSGESFIFSDILLPGKLDGFYRWVYTHYDPTTGRESQPSPVTNSGFPIEVTGQPQGVSTSSKGMARSVALIPTTDVGVDATTTQMRFYRNGGVPSLTKDSRGRDVWYRVQTILDLTLLADPITGSTAGDTSIKMAANPGTAGWVVGQWIVIDRGNTGSEEFVQITALTATNIVFLKQPLQYNHAAGVTVQVICEDNASNAEVDIATPIDLDRSDPPTAARWIGRSPDGRLYLANFSGDPTGVAVSNKATVDRPTDYEVFPNVDPLTTRSLTQGFRFTVGGDVTDEQVEWAGFYRDTFHMMTRANLYRLTANSQVDFGPLALQKVMGVGCLAGHTVAEADGRLYWVAPGPRVANWQGAVYYAGGQAEPAIVSSDMIRNVLHNSPSAYWGNWFGRGHARRDGNYYLLYLTPSGQTVNTLRLDYNVEYKAWESNTWYNSMGNLIGWMGALTQVGGTSASEVQNLYAASGAQGLTYQMETGTTDATQAIRISYSSKKFDLQAVSLLKDWYAYLSAVSDTLTLSLTVFGSEYGVVTKNYTITLSGSTETELWQRLSRTLRGRWAQISITGNVVNGPSIRTQRLRYLPFRERRVVV